MPFHKTKLANNLEIVAETNDNAFSCSFGFFVKTGSRNELPELSGISHFLEHMIFKGTGTLDSRNVNLLFDKIGADANAFTTEEQTVFYASVLPEFLEEAVEIFARILRPALRDSDFEIERQVILEEISMYEDQPPFGADDKSRELFFSGHPLANSVLGTRESILALTPQMMRDYHADRYSPENIVLIATGKLDFDLLLRKTELLCESWKPQSIKPNSGDVLRKVVGNRGIYKLSKKNASQFYAMLLADAPSANDYDRYAAAILANVIGDDVGSRLFWELIESGIADTAGLASYEFFDNGFYVAGISCEPDAAAFVLDKTQEILETVQKYGITQEELTRASSKILSRLIMVSERPSGRLFVVGNDWTASREYSNLSEEIERIRAISLDDIHTVLAKYPLTNPLIVTLSEG